MSTGLSGPPPAPEFEPHVVKPSAAGLVIILFTGAIGVLSFAFALNPDFADGLVHFAGDAYRVGLAIIGGFLTFLAARGVARMLRGDKTLYDRSTHQRAKNIGLVLVLIGVVLLVAAAVTPVGEATVLFSGWTKPVYIVFGVLTLPMGLLQQWNPTKFHRRQRVAAGEGRSGTAKILRASDTGMLINSRPQVEIDVEISVGGAPPYAAKTKHVMEQSKLALLIPGSTVEVTVDVVDASVFEIDWDRWTAPAGL